MPDLSERKAPAWSSRRPFGSTIAFTLLTFAASWLLWTAGFAIQERDLPLSSGFMPIGGSLYLLGVFAPALVAVSPGARWRCCGSRRCSSSSP